MIDSILSKNSRIFTQCYAVMYFYPAQLPILRRETNEHIYKFSAYYVAEIVNALPICFLRSFSGLTISYYWAGFNTGFLLYLKIGLTLMISSFTANAYGLMMSNMFKIAISEVASITDLIFLCISGFYMNLNSFPYIRYISLFFFSNEALAILFWSDVDEIGKHPTQFVFIQCLNVDFIFLFHFLFVASSQNTECSPKFEGKCFRNGTDVLRSMSYRTELIDVLYDYVGLVILGLIMHLLAYSFTRRNIRSVGYY